jgi:hypothetical protein
MRRTFHLIAFHCAATVPLYWISGMFSNHIALAQPQLSMHADCPEDGAPCPGVLTIGPGGDIEIVKNEPYEAQATTVIKQTLVDGSHTTQTGTAMIARDSDGRTVHVQKLSDGTTVTMIFDPIARTTTHYTSDTKVAHVMTLPATLPSGAMFATGPGFSGSTAGPTGAAVGGFFLQGHMSSPQTTNRPNTTTQSLGTKTIEGIQVSGTRSTSTIPAGAIGNDKDIPIIRETWRSAELKLVVLDVQDDPRVGQTTYSLTNIQPGEPEAALFQVPADYTVTKIAMPEPPR